MDSLLWGNSLFFDLLCGVLFVFMLLHKRFGIRNEFVQKIDKLSLY